MLLALISTAVLGTLSVANVASHQIHPEPEVLQDPVGLVAPEPKPLEKAEQAQGAQALTPLKQSSRNASYTMQVKLSPEARTVTGHQVLTWRNTTQHPVTELRYHLYYNAWRNAASSALTNPNGRGNSKLGEYGPDDWAYVDVSKVERLGADGQSARVLKYDHIAPDDGNTEDQTVLRVALQQAVEPGATIQVAMDWVSKVPKTFARTGMRGDYFFLAQWFPKIGVWEPDGKWNCHQFISTEFYADFGDYDVEINAPEGWVVGATGREVKTTPQADGSVVHKFHQSDVHDFAWTASPHFTVETAKFEQEGLPSVDMRLLLMPDHQGQAQRYFDATSAALEKYGQWWGAYPYGHITVVDPAYKSGTGGMEYPTLFTGGSRWLTPVESRRPEGVTVHEAGHQFWYGLVANNEFEHAWLDEGFNTYSTTRTLEARFPDARVVKRYFDGFLPMVFDDIHVAERTASASGMAGPHSVLVRDALATHAWLDGPGSYRNNAYTKPALILRTLENHLGWTVFQKVVSTYFERYRYRHPKPGDFFAIVHEISGQDLNWFFDQVYAGTPVFDYAVGKVKSKKVKIPRGYGATVLEFIEGGGGSSDDDDDQKTEIYKSSVFVRRWGDGVFPVEVKVEFKDGSHKLERWDGKARWHRFEYTGASPVTRVDVDPSQVLVLDVDRTNNGWVKKSQAKVASYKWAGKWMLWMQHLAEAFVMFS